MTLYALRFARFALVEDFLRLGWAISFPNAAMHHHYYGCELAWLCPCPVPGDSVSREIHRVPDLPPTESAHERADHRTQ